MPRKNLLPTPSLHLAALLVASLACNMPGLRWTVKNTQEALDKQGTQLAQIAASLSRTALPAGQLPSPSATFSPTQTATLMRLDTPAPTFDPRFALLDERLRRSARILLFENMSASRYIRFVKEALDQDGYFYVDVGSAKGWFKTQLESQVDWDLIIAAVENRRDFEGSMGELFEVLDGRLVEGASAIVEYGDFDDNISSRAKVLLDRCGLELAEDWYEPPKRNFTWALLDHPIFHLPNSVRPQLGNATRLYHGDIGDLLLPKSGAQGNDAQLLATTVGKEVTGAGVLAVCLAGRLTIQTFASHEYVHEDILPLWKNYIYNALKARFSDAPPATPFATAKPGLGTIQAMTAQPLAPNPGLPTCQGLLAINLLKRPGFQVDLFEHHAQGVFALLRVELANLSRAPLQIWDGDYFLAGILFGQPVSYPLHRAATIYLYVDDPMQLWQENLQAGEAISTQLAFDIPSQGESWELVVRPGYEFDEPLCEARLPLAE